MKFFLMLVLATSYAVAAPNHAQKAATEKPEVRKEQVKPKGLSVIEKDEEDCDEKAKKPIEIKPESISLSGNTGCTLE